MYETATKIDVSVISSIWALISTGYEGRLVLNFLFCILTGIIIGKDRERKGKAAGVSTISLVACGAMLFTFVSGMTESGDPTRIAAQIVSGIGFLGAGVIITRKEGGDKKIENVTTAASIWFTAAIGMVVGFELYLLAVISIFFTYIIFRWLPHFDGDSNA